MGGGGRGSKADLYEDVIKIKYTSFDCLCCCGITLFPGRTGLNGLYFCIFPRLDLIDVSIESAVAQMQSVIELGRYIRDVKVMPIKVHVYNYVYNHISRTNIGL